MGIATISGIIPSFAEAGSRLIVFVPILGFALSWGLLAVLLRTGAASRLAIDEPNHRSLHKKATPRIGGLGIVAGMLACAPFLTPLLCLLVVSAGMLAALSFFDDRRGVPLLIRLGAHVAAALLWVGMLGGWPPVLGAIAVLMLVWMTNLYNFMDGADGLAGGMAIIGFSAYGVGSWLGGQPEFALLCAVVAAASLGFLLFNFSPARIFMGDVGSISLGFLSGALGLLGWRLELWPVWFPLLVFSPFIVDATLTLLRRMLSGKRFWEAHREHYYQRLLRAGCSHRRAALAEYALMVVAAASALLAVHADVVLQAAVLGGWGLVYVALAWRVDAAWRGQEATPS